MKKVCLSLLVLFVSLFGLSKLADASVSSIALHNDTAEFSTDCPREGNYWHFVFAPNNGSSEFVKLVLNLSGNAVEFSGSQIILNSGQKDNIFVAVPSGFGVASLIKTGSYATYLGSTPTNFVLSHVCGGQTTTTTTSTSSTTSTTSTTSTSSTSTTSTTVPKTTVPMTSTTVVTTTSLATTTVPDSTTTVTEPEIGEAASLARTGSNSVVFVLLGISLIITGLFLTRRSKVL